MLVAASEGTQLARMQARDGLTLAEAEARIRAQMPLAAKAKLAAIVIENDGSLEDLLRHADAALADVASRVGVPIDRYPVPATTARGASKPGG